jgi:hypothetical protein
MVVKPRRPLLALCLFVPTPTIGAVFALLIPGTRETPVGESIWAVSKVWMILFPFVWYVVVDRGRWSLSPSSARGLGAGLLMSIPVAAAIFAAYLLVKDTLIDPEEVRRTIDELGIGTPARFLIFASAMSLVNSLLEEYAWRWFVFTRCKAMMGTWAAIVTSAALFTVHHAFALSASVPPGANALACGGIFAGGIAWAWLYNRYQSIWPGWICHVAADIAVMWVAWSIIS